MFLGLRGRTAVVLASTSGLGYAVAERLVREGARVAVCGRDAGRLEEALERLRAAAREEEAGEAQVLGRRTDVTDPDALAVLFADARAALGPVGVLVTNAGGPPPGPATETRDEDWRAALELTLLSAVRAIRLALPDMRAARWGRIVALTSIAVRQPIPGLVQSNALRAGLTGYLKTLADEVAAEGIRVNSVCTGLFATRRLEELLAKRAAAAGRSLEEERAAALAGVPAGRFGDPAELADLVTFLVSERCSYMTGVALAYDGGLSRGLL